MGTKLWNSENLGSSDMVSKAHRTRTLAESAHDAVLDAFFLPDTAFSLDAKKTRLWCCKKVERVERGRCCRVATVDAVAELPLFTLQAK